MAVEKAGYEIETYAGKVRQALKNMEATTAPGERNGKGRRMDVMRAVKTDVERLVAMGYTVGQIADAITGGDVFKILPKSITQMLNETDRLAKTGSISTKDGEARTGVFQNKTPRVRDTVTRNKPSTSKNGNLAVEAGSKASNKPAMKAQSPQTSGRTGPKPDRD